jgi:alanyl-tRNA synthetase
MFAQYFRDQGIAGEDVCVVSADAGRTKLAKKFSEMLDASLAIISKDRPTHGVAEVIDVIGAEKVRGGTRLTFVCGGRALRALRGYRDAVAGSVRSLSVLPHELPAAVERIQHDGKQARKTIARLQSELAVHEAARLIASSPVEDRVRRVVHVVDGWDAAGVKAVASSMAAEAGVTVVLVGASAPITIVVARSSDVSLDANAVLQQLLKRFGGRGGGKPDLAQGAGLTGEPQDIATAARELIRT